MKKDEIVARLTDMISEILDNKNINIAKDTPFHDIEGFDSISKVMLFAETEDVFSIHLNIDEISLFETISDITDLIVKKRCNNDSMNKSATS